MEYLLMTEMMDPSFLDDEAPGVCWGQWASEGDQKSGKRKQPEDKTEQPPKMQRREQCGVSSNGWQQVDDLPDPLVVDLESSCGLSGLAVDSSYLRASACSPDSGNSPLGADGGHSPVPHPHQLVSSANNPEGETENYRNNKLLVTSEPATSTGSPPLDVTEDCRFQYVLAAATSIATKVNEETLTYLNQGQSYEIKLKKLGDLTVYRGKILKSVVKLCFHERRLQFMEQEQIAAWRASRPGDRIVEVDLPLSYGMYDLIQDPAMLNTVEFLWDPTKEVGVYIKVNCISTEFTPKKHGGEKGVPFRIQVETYLQHEKMCRHLHSASCQIKVFKLKGADRKHKQDRDKLLKRPECEREKYQPSYDCTVLSDVPITNECVFSSPLHLSPEPKGALQTSNVKPQGSGDIQMIKTSHTPPMPALADRPQNNDTVQGGLVGSASPQQTMTWLQTNRFAAYLHTFASFSGADLMRLSRDDLIQICGLADGIRLFNALHPRAKTVYLCVQQSPVVYQAVYLATLSSREMCSKAAALVGLSLTQLSQVYMQGPNGIHVLVTDELVRNIKDEATFATELISDQSGEGLCLLLKPPPL
ncbi:transcription factor CP2-like protein 1 isoform X2 [Macrosteles quadrilineatus]|uniref:transcription factor CP2-like protein 1 isoform X2 n=1 Tax=Macrosteles quadrilineatus TaxID=74068 RepID=UPI0023E13A1F|nr:transcription factor CP2-like protein 1 isoform X2 [Macrosteles quadrilineatus]XP_054276196.1 transcription factor CP2-like protein 1 isoform X2 [Macrosteles quadrilineatus]